MAPSTAVVVSWRIPTVHAPGGALRVLHVAGEVVSGTSRGPRGEVGFGAAPSGLSTLIIVDLVAAQ